MISLDRLLDGLDVTVQPFTVRDLRVHGLADRVVPSGGGIRRTRSGLGELELVGGAILRLCAHSLAILPPPARTRSVPEAGARRKPNGRLPAAVATEANTMEPRAGDPDVMVAVARIRADYEGTVGLFDQLREPLVQQVPLDDAIRRCFIELLEEAGGRRPGSRAMVETLLRECLVLLMRRFAEQGERRLFWLAALEDEGSAARSPRCATGPRRPSPCRGSPRSRA